MLTLRGGEANVKGWEGGMLMLKGGRGGDANVKGGGGGGLVGGLNRICHRFCVSVHVYSEGVKLKAHS